MNSKNFYSGNDDIQFHIEKRLNWDELFAWLSEEEKEAIGAANGTEYLKSWSEVLDTLGEICGNQIADNAEKVDQSKYKIVDGIDQVPQALKDNCDTLLEFGISSLGVPPQYGGTGAPFILEMVAGELLNRACPSTMLNVGWYGSIAHILEAFATDEIKKEYIEKIATGEWSGNMALTEPDAGSDLGALRTYGVKQDDGSWTLHGTKRFITNGTSHISLVLAKNEKGAEGLGTLSLFVCPRHIDGKENIKVLKLEDKIGLHGSATAELAYDGSKAWILGKEGEGFKYMLRLMNDARIGVGFQGLGLMEATWRIAHTYAHDRKSWGKPLAQHEMIAEQLLDLEVELKAIRSLCYQAAFNQSKMYLGEKKLKEEGLEQSERKEIERQLAKSKKRLRRWTPLLKYWVGEKSIIHARQAVQILGGYGYTTEYRAEWWVRESLIYSLYEGTSQIQSLMCMKDALKDVVRNPRLFIETVLGLKLKGITDSNPLKKKLYRIKHVAQNSILSLLIKLLKTNVKARFEADSDGEIKKLIKTLSRDLVKFENIQPALLHAEKICEIKCLEALSETLVWDASTDESRTWIAERFMFKALPRIQYLKSLIEGEDEVIQSRLDSFAEKAQ